MLGNLALDIENFRVNGKGVVDYICKYLATIDSRSVVPTVSPGYLAKIMPEEAPENPEQWCTIMEDVERVIMPGVTHWQHPRFHAYFPAGNSFPSIMGDMISDAIGCVGFSWASSPACTELEIIMLDWLAKMMNLPKEFLHSSNKGGGGVIQSSASDSILVSMLSARYKTIRNVKLKYEINLKQEANINVIEGVILSQLVGYCSKLAHSSIEKAGIISFVKIRPLEIDDDFSLRGSTLETAIIKDMGNKLIPFFVCVTLGTTTCCSFDNLQEIGEICNKYKIWLHVDASYAGSSFICPEFQYRLKGIEYVDTINFNPNKFMLVNFDCSVLWVRRSKIITEFMNVDPVYLQHKNSKKTVDFRHWGIPLSRRFRALKLWFVIRSYGVLGLQNYIRNHVLLASKFELLVKSNQNFEVIGKVVLGLVCFRLKGDNVLNELLIQVINESGKIHLTPSKINEIYILRFCVCSEHATVEDINIAWKIIESTSEYVLKIKSPLQKLNYIKNQRGNLRNKKMFSDVITRKLSENELQCQNTRVIKSLETPSRGCYDPESLRPILNMTEDKSYNFGCSWNSDMVKETSMNDL